jgi:hypothetical protein
MHNDIIYVMTRHEGLALQRNDTYLVRSIIVEMCECMTYFVSLTISPLPVWLHIVILKLVSFRRNTATRSNCLYRIGLTSLAKKESKSVSE